MVRLEHKLKAPTGEDADADIAGSEDAVVVVDGAVDEVVAIDVVVEPK
jgi:hypothetical protein